MTLNRTLFSMLEFQEEHNIVGQCVTNVIFILKKYKCINEKKISAKPVYMVYQNPNIDKFEMFAGHLVISLEGDKIIDPSYETNSKPNQRYFHSIADLIIHYPELNNKEYIRDIIKTYVQFAKLSDIINNNEYFELAINQNKYFQELSDYITSELILFEKGIVKESKYDNVPLPNINKIYNIQSI